MLTANVHEAKTSLSKLLERAEPGDEVIIARAGVPVVRMVAVSQKTSKRPRGLLHKQIVVRADFDDDDPIRADQLDRLLIAQAGCEELTLVTHDRRLAS
jgi:prevent-host-death family protein